MKTFALFLLFVPLLSFACDQGFFPPHRHSIPANSLMANDMTEKQFKDAVTHFERFFGPGIEDEHDAELILFSDWKTNTVNAYAERKPGKIMISIYGGLARHKAMNLDGLNLVLCHELGHHLGGYPKKSGNRWSSAEGQADYYATMKCLRRLWEKENNEVNAHPHVKQECAKSWSERKDQALCERMSMAGKAVALMIQDLDHDSIEPRFETPDELQVRSINYMHPFAQCRLDTFFNGSLCPVPQGTEFDDHDEEVGSCHPRHGIKRGLRPACWFVHRM